MDIKDRQNTNFEATKAPEGLSPKEQRYFQIMQELVQNKISLASAAEQLGITQRQVRNKLKRIKEEGFTGLAHKNRGRPSNRRLPEAIVEKIKVLIRTESAGLGATALAQLIKDKHNLEVSRETVRKLMKEQGVPTRGKRRSKKKAQAHSKSFSNSNQNSPASQSSTAHRTAHTQPNKDISSTTSSLGSYMNKDTKNHR
jgi:transposase